VNIVNMSSVIRNGDDQSCVHELGYISGTNVTEILETIANLNSQISSLNNSSSSVSSWRGNYGDHYILKQYQLAGLLHQLKPEDFVLKLDELDSTQDSEERLDRLLECCVLDILGDVWITATGIMLSINASEKHPKIFDKFVRSLWRIIAPDKVNELDRCHLRSAACNCLREIELCIPQSLEAIVRKKEGEEKSMLELCVVDERSHAYQAYLLLFLTILSQTDSSDEKQTNTKLNAMSLVIESISLLSQPARFEALELASRLLAHDKSVCLFLAHHAVESLGLMPSASAFRLLFEISTRLNWWKDESHLHKVDRLSGLAIHDWNLPIKTRAYICQLRHSAAREYNIRFNPSFSLPSGFDDVNAQVFLALTTLETFGCSSPQNVGGDIVNVSWFVDEFYRERTPGSLTSSVLKVFSQVLKLFPNDNVAERICEHLTQGGALRGGSRFFQPLETILNLSSDKKFVKLIILSVSDAVADIQDPLDTLGFFKVIEKALAIDSEERDEQQLYPSRPTRGLLALDRYIEIFQYSPEKWDQVQAYLSCCRCAFSNAKQRCDPRAYQFAVRLVEKLYQKNPKDFILADECEQLLRLAQALMDGIPSAIDIMKPLDDRIPFTHEDSFSPAISEIKNIHSVEIGRFLHLERAQSQVIDDNEHATTFKIDLRLYWKDDEDGSETAISELFALEIHLIDVADRSSAAFEGMAQPLIVPYISRKQSEVLLKLYLIPKFPCACRLSFRGLATDAEQNILEGQLQDVSLSFVDWFIFLNKPMADSASYTDRVTIVRERVTRESAEKLLKNVFKLSGEINGASDVNVFLKPHFHLRFKFNYDEGHQSFQAEIEVDHWVLLSYIDELFRFS
jgi:hypothetical protein